MCFTSVSGQVDAITGIVRDESGRAVAEATVRHRATAISTQTDDDGRFALEGIPADTRVRLTAWADGYCVAGRDVGAHVGPVELTLTSYSLVDHSDYAWVPPSIEDRSIIVDRVIGLGLALAARVSFHRALLPLAERLTLGCRDCHAGSVHEQWSAGAHARGTGNVRFLTMYNGTDVSGNRSPPTRYGIDRNYGAFPLRPDSARSYLGPGYRLDFPGTAGNCAACHLPGAAIDDPYRTDPNEVTGADARGVHCDVCHKIAAVSLDPATGRPRENMPGVLSMAFARPSEGSQVFFGPYDDVDVGPDAFLPLMKESEICAPCHDARFWGVPIYESFGEWLASPYPAEEKTCQSCHMRPDGVTTNFAPGRGGLERDPQSISTHGFPGAADTLLLREALTMGVAAERGKGRVRVRVTVANERTGHHVPTDSPLRQVILLVRARDGGGTPLALLDGPALPGWAGVGPPEERYYAGLPGRAYAKILEERWTGVVPTAACWNPTRIRSDSRIAAMEADTSAYVFDATGDGEVGVEAVLLFRRAFKRLADQKGWDVPDILMSRQALVLQGLGEEKPTNR